MASRRTVHIPIVQPGSVDQAAGEDRLIEVYTQHETFDVLTRHEQEVARSADQKARDKDWDRVAAPLRKAGLYQAGCAAASAVRKLGIRRPLTALYQQVSRLAWIEGQRLHAAAPSGPTEGRSAELGLALVLLMGASASRDRHVIATGALGGQPHGLERDDVEVLPVGSLPAKLRLVRALAENDALPGISHGREILFLTPLRFDDGGTWREVRTLPDVEALGRLGVKVAPVGRLGEAAEILRAHRARHLAADRVAAVALIGFVGLLGATGAWSALREDHVNMVFMPGGGAALDAEPFEACFTKDGGYYPIPLERRGLGRQLPAGSTLAWRVRVGTPADARTGLGRLFAPEAYHVAQVMVAERSRAKVMVPEVRGADEVRVRPGGIWEWGWTLNERAENNGLVLLSRGDRPFDPQALRQQLIERFPVAAAEGPDDQPLDVTAAVNFIAGTAPGAASFIVETVEEPSRCNP